MRCRANYLCLAATAWAASDGARAAPDGSKLSTLTLDSFNAIVATLDCESDAYALRHTACRFARHGGPARGNTYYLEDAAAFGPRRL